MQPTPLSDDRAAVGAERVVAWLLALVTAAVSAAVLLGLDLGLDLALPV